MLSSLALFLLGTNAALTFEAAVAPRLENHTGPDGKTPLPWGARCLNAIDLPLMPGIYKDIVTCGDYTIGHRGLPALGIFHRCFDGRGTRGKKKLPHTYTHACSACLTRLAFCSGLHCTHLCGRTGSKKAANPSEKCIKCNIGCSSFVFTKCAGINKNYKDCETIGLPDELSFLCGMGICKNRFICVPKDDPSLSEEERALLELESLTTSDILALAEEPAFEVPGGNSAAQFLAEGGWVPHTSEVPEDWRVDNVDWPASSSPMGL